MSQCWSCKEEIPTSAAACPKCHANQSSLAKDKPPLSNDSPTIGRAIDAAERAARSVDGFIFRLVLMASRIAAMLGLIIATFIMFSTLGGAVTGDGALAVAASSLIAMAVAVIPCCAVWFVQSLRPTR